MERRIRVSLTCTCPSDLNYENEEDKKEEYQLTSSSPSHYLPIREAMPLLTKVASLALTGLTQAWSSCTPSKRKQSTCRPRSHNFSPPRALTFYSTKYFALATRTNIDPSVFICLTLIEPGGTIIIFCRKIAISLETNICWTSEQSVKLN